MRDKKLMNDEILGKVLVTFKSDEFVKSQKTSFFVIPAEAGIQ